MSQLDNLLAAHYPDGVPHKKLGDIATLLRGNGMPKTMLSESGVGAIHYGQIYTKYGTSATTTISFVSEDDAKKLTKADSGDIIITNTSENLEDVGKAVAWLGTDQIVTGGHATVIKHDFDPRFLSYWFQTPDFYIQKKKLATGTKVIDVSAKQLEKIVVPVPSVEIQRHIADILDTFSEMEAELEAELEARKQQYEHYRDHAFDSALRDEWIPMGSVGKFERGSALQKKDLTDEGVPCFHYGQVYTHYGVKAAVTKSFVTEDFARGKRVLNPGDVFVATTSENEEDLGKSVAWLGDTMAVASSDAYIFRSGFDARYVSYFFSSSHFHDQKKRFITGTKVKRISGGAMEKMVIPNIPLEEQENIADALDKFDALVNDLSIGLPAELAARRQQYEYYRDKLLTFRELEPAS